MSFDVLRESLSMLKIPEREFHIYWLLSIMSLAIFIYLISYDAAILKRRFGFMVILFGVSVVGFLYISIQWTHEFNISEIYSHVVPIPLFNFDIRRDLDNNQYISQVNIDDLYREIYSEENRVSTYATIVLHAVSISIIQLMILILVWRIREGIVTRNQSDGVER